jgi:hypothetical protein
LSRAEQKKTKIAKNLSTIWPILNTLEEFGSSSGGIATDGMEMCAPILFPAGLVQPLLVVAHAGFHQQRTDLDFHPYHLANQEPAGYGSVVYASAREW